MRGTAQRLLRRTAVSARKHGFSTQGGACSRACVASGRSPYAADRAAGGQAGGEEAEKLGFVTALGAPHVALRTTCARTHTCPLYARLPASGGLVAASTGAIAVFGLGVLGVMGAAKGAASLLGVFLR